MYLLNAHTRQLQDFIGDRTPPYAILSHTWGEDEVLFEDLQDPKHKEKLGYQKIEWCCQQTIRDGYIFVWIDTCCIDKRSSAELSEAINSMFRWYGEADVCYVYLVDVLWEDESEHTWSNFRNSRWFTRGWTLQELIAPVHLKFFDKTWSTIFVVYKNGHYWSKPINHIVAIEEATRIMSWDEYWMKRMNSRGDSSPVAAKLSWASGRQTTRIEDMAYCLLGLLDVNMPLLYGEGNKAFLRLQEEFLKKHHDTTIILWGFQMDGSAIRNIINDYKTALGYGGYGCFAPTPSLFRGFRGVRLTELGHHLRRTPRFSWNTILDGLHMELRMTKFDARQNIYMGLADCMIDNSYLVFALQKYYRSPDTYVLIRPLLLETTPTQSLIRRRPKPDFEGVKWEAVYLYRSVSGSNSVPIRRINLGSRVDIMLDDYRFVLDDVYPPASEIEDWRAHAWAENTLFLSTHFIFVLHREERDTVYIRVTWVHKPWMERQKQYKIMVCSCPYGTKRSAIEVWDAGRGVSERFFSDPPDLNWQEATEIKDENGVDKVSARWEAMERKPEWGLGPDFEWVIKLDVKRTYHG